MSTAPRLIVVLLLLLVSAAHADTLQTCTNSSSFQCQSDSFTTNLLEYVKPVSRALSAPVVGQMTGAGATTPTPIFTATPTTQGASPTPTPFTFTSCAVEALSTNTASVFLGSDNSLVTTNGWELLPGQSLANIPTVDGDCGYLWVVSGSASQKVAFEQER
jgi:hypothetical protein